VKFASASDVLVVKSGAQFLGEIAGGGGTLLISSGSGTISGLGGSGMLTGSASAAFAGFGTYALDFFNDFTLAGTNTLAAGQTLDDYANLTVTGSVDEALGAVILGGMTFKNGGGGTFAGTLEAVGPITFLKGADTFDGTQISGRVVLSNANATLLGQITVFNHGRISIGSRTVSVGAGGATLSGNGQIVFTNSATNRVVGLSSSDTLSVDLLVSGAGQIGGGQMTLAVESGGTIDANGTQAMVIDTGTNMITNGGLIEDTGAGGLTIESAIQNNGQLIAQNGTLTELGAVTGTGSAKIGNGGTLVFASSFGQNVTFSGNSGELVLAQSQGYAGTISGFSTSGGTSLDLRDIGFVSSIEATWSGGVLTVTDGTHTAHITLAGDFSGSTFTAASDGQGGVIVTDPSASLLRQSVATGFGTSSGLGTESFHALVAPLHVQLAGAVG
jgi:hypothetical protein